MEEISDNIGIAILLVIILVVGLFTVIIIASNSETMVPTRIEKEYAVSDPSLNQYINTQYIPKEKPLVYQYNGIEWVEINSAYVTWTEGTKNVTVSHTPLFG